VVAADIPTLNQNTTGTAAISTAATVTTSTAASAFKVPFANTTASTTGNYGLLQDSTATFTYNPSTNTLVAGTFSGALSGNATTATTLQTARTIGGVSFNGSANIDLPGVNTAGNQNTTGSAATLTTTRTLWGQNFNGSANVTGALTSVGNITGTGAVTLTATSGTLGLTATGANVITATTNAVERLRIDSNGNLLVGTTSALNSSNTILMGTNTADLQLTIGGGLGAPGVAFHFGNNTVAANAANSVMKLGQMSVTARSISAAGTINAAGLDYAEYMTKAGDFTIAKGDVVGINAEGKLTNVFDDAVSFCVKSTNPSYVGGDVWGRGYDNDPDGLEAARHCVDRIAFAGQVPVNVIGATPGQFIIPINDNGEIKGEAVSNPTFEQYQLAVGKVIAVDVDGRARIIVKIA
jgi:hypothetical protein